MPSPAAFVDLQERKYLNLESFRKNGAGVRTPVWFAAEPQKGPPQRLYVYSDADSGKAKRIRNNPRIRVAACDMRGRLLGNWVEALAAIVSGDEAQRAMALLNRKYMPWRQLLAFFSLFRRRERAVFRIEAAA